MRITQWLAAGALAGAMALTGAAAHGQDYADEYRVSTIVPSPFPWGIAAEAWAELVAERTDGRIVMGIYPGAQLVGGEQTREFSALRRGIIDMAVGSTINWSPQVPELNVFSLPFLMDSYADIDALTQGEVGDRLFEILEENGVVPLAWAENGFRELSNSRGPVRTPEDMVGLKVRVVGSPIFIDTFSALGANPTQMSWADAQPALATGAVDGQENPLTVFTFFHLEEMGQTNVTLWHYLADPLIFAVNRDVWESFTPEDQEIVREAALEAGRIGVEAAREGLLGDDPPMISEVEELGVDVVQLTEAERDAFREATATVWDEWTEVIGQDLVEMAVEAVADN